MEELVTGKRARAEDATPVVAYRRPMESLDDAYLSAEERADRIEKELKALAPMMAALTPHLYRANRADFDRQAKDADEVISRVMALVIGLRMAAKSEYAPSPWHVRLILWFFSFVGAVHRTRLVLVKAQSRYEARIEAAQEYERLAKKSAKGIQDIRNANVYARRDQILLENKEYQNLIARVPGLQASIDYNFEYPESEDYYEAKLQEVQGMAEIISVQALRAAAAEVPSEDQ